MSEPWLVGIDLQVVFADPASPWAAPRFEEIVPPVSRLIERFGDRTVLTRFVPPSVPSGAWQDYYAAWPFALTSADYGLVTGVTAPHVLDAPTFGKWTPDLADLLGPDPTMVVCGVATDCCVLSTVLAAADAGARIIVAQDACAGSSDEAHDQALALLALYGPLVTVTTSALLLEQAVE